MLANELSRRGHEITVVSWDEHEASSFYPLDAGIAWLQLGFSPGLWDKFRRTWALFRALRQVRPAVFVGFVMGADKSVYLANLLARVPIIAAERNAPDMYGHRFSPLKRWFYLSLLGLCRRVLIQLEQYRLGYPRSVRTKIRVIENPVAPPRLMAHPARRSSIQPILLTVGRLDPQKNFDVLIRAFALLRDQFPEWRLRIVGEGGERRRLKQLVDSLDLAARVELPGATSAIEEEYAAAHLFALPSRWEGFPNALAEALTHGLPAVGFAGCPGVNALIQPEVNGLLAEGLDNSANLADALSRLMADDTLREGMGKAAVLSMERFAPAEIFDRWENVLLEAASEGACHAKK